MKIYSDDDREYYEKIAPLGRKDLLKERASWQRKFKRKKIPWTFRTADDLSTDEIYLQLIDIHRAYQKGA